MAIKWCHNAKTKEIFSYEVSGGITDFPRGQLLAYGDYLTTGIESKAAAEKWGMEWTACSVCRAAVPGKPGDKCSRCGTILK